MNNNKISSYLLYAIGEIVLVVVGILLALNINNWNLEKVRKEKEKLYLESIRTDLQKSLVDLERDIKTIDSLNKVYETILDIAESNNAAGRSEEEILSLYMALGNYTIFEDYNGSFREIINSGSLNTISNPDIRRAIVDWETSLIPVREWEASQRGNQKAAIDLLNQNTNIYNQVLGRKTAIKASDLASMGRNIYFLNKLAERIFLNRNLKSYYKSKSEEILKFINLIDAELKSE